MDNDNGNITASTLELSLEQVHKRILKLVEQGHRNAYQVGRLYNYVVDSELAQKGGFKDAQDFFREKVKVLGQSVLSRNGAVARSFSEGTALKYGISNLYTLMTYARLAGLSLEHGEPGTTPVLVPQKDGTLLSKPFEECTVDELQGAVKHKRTPPVPLAEHDAARVQRYRDNLQRHFTGKLSIRVDARNHMGELLITLRDIPEKEMRRLAAALADESVPQQEEGARVEVSPQADLSATPTPPAMPMKEAPLGDDASAAASPATQGAANDDAPSTPTPSVEPVRGVAHSDNPVIPPSPATQVPAPLTVAPMAEGTRPDTGVPAQGAPAQGQEAPRNKGAGLSGFLRRMAGG
ncbi:hypothetical protein ACLESO_32400 [Pyxidicoccus sp. 3LG]